ncbi:MAG TPA: hypothetical protein VD837_01575 [Terriglobales bacterium]|nr:hypothetical protein [Terriglobales bacterium]
MKHAIAIGALLLVATVYAQNEHGTCSEDGFVSLPLRGWVGYTNTGESQSDMTVECFTNPDEPPIASTKPMQPEGSLSRNSSPESTT